jgi:HNH endonuclease
MGRSVPPLLLSNKPLAMGRRAELRRGMSLSYRLLDHISIAGSDQCWNWQTAETTRGRIQITIDGKKHYAHRVVYEWLRGPIPEGRGLHHTCGNERCVNPKHLLPVTHAEHQVEHNYRGIKTRAANARAKTHCKNGHEYTEENIYWTKEGWRRCNECRRIVQRRHYHEALS